jgi:hypothetical protein
MTIMVGLLGMTILGGLLGMTIIVGLPGCHGVVVNRDDNNDELFRW